MASLATAATAKDLQFIQTLARSPPPSRRRSSAHGKGKKDGDMSLRKRDDSRIAVGLPRPKQLREWVIKDDVVSLDACVPSALLLFR